MSDIIIRSSASVLPSPAVDISIRLATLSDLPAIDALQKKYHKQLGFFPRGQMEEYLRNGWVVVAEESGQCSVVGGQSDARPSLTTDHRPPTTRLLGYCASRDRYLKRDELGVIYQLCVDPGAQRKFVGAALLQAVFERAPYGCRLFCCWCAQDIAANYFWESMGFVPLAFRAGGRHRGQKSEVRGQRSESARVHIFWQKRIVAGDTATQYWFPSETGGGAMGEDRLVLPIPPGVRWSDEMPRVLPGEQNPKSETLNPKQIQSTKSEGSKPKTRKKPAEVVVTKQTSLAGSLGFFRKKDAPFDGAQGSSGHRREKPVRPPRVRMKNDPKLIAAARELRDRWLEEVNAGKYLPETQGKYEVSRAIATTASPTSARLSTLAA